MLKPISTLVRAGAAAGRQFGRRRAGVTARRLLAAAAVTATAAGLLSVPPAGAAVARPQAHAAASAASTAAAKTRAAKVGAARTEASSTEPTSTEPAKSAIARTSAAPSGVRPAADSPAKAHGGLPAGQKAVCGPVKPGYATCQSIVRTTGVKAHRGVFASGTAPPGYGPADLRSAYNLPATGGSGQTVAVIDAYDNPDAASDLAIYRQQYGLPACTTANGCFRKVSQDGSTTDYPEYNATWSVEIDLDLDMVSAICPECHILLVEADDDSIQNLGTAVDEAVKLGAKYVSNSYGGPEDPAEVSWDSAYYDHPGVAVTAASGDTGFEDSEPNLGDPLQGYGASYPATSPYVTAVGGTTLTPDSGSARGWTESAWDYGGSGCSSYEPKPAWQHDTGCPMRTEADVAAVADPSTGVAVYTSSPVAGFPGWNVIGGTSVATPIIASVYALAGTPLPGTTPASYPYSDPSALNNITTGSNSLYPCSITYLCTAGTGYNGPTGLGTPDGVAAFTLPHGDVTGTVTSASGTPLAGATVQAGTTSAVTNADGDFDLTVAAGSYKITALDLSGYASQAATGVQVASGQSVTQNFTLSPAANVSLTGTVTDGSGQGWPVYAKVTLAGTTDTAYTSPFTGRYTLKVPPDGSYTVQAQAVSGGYEQAQQTVTASAGDLTASFAVKADPYGCTATGYGRAPALSEAFDGDTVPAGWSVVTNGNPSASWQFDQPDGLPNETYGGSGNYATAFDPDARGNSTADTSLITPPINLSADPYPMLQFDWFDDPDPGQLPYSDDVDASTDGGQTWTPVWSYNSTSDPTFDTTVLALPELAGLSSVEFRFHWTYQEEAEFADGNYADWQIDNVVVSSCQASPGGLVVGRVTDGNTGQGVAGATVTDGAQSVTSTTIPGDASAGGLYSMFTPQTGSQQVTASAPGYAVGTKTISVTSGAITQASLALAAGRLAAAPASVTGTTAVGGKTTATFTVSNTGTLPVTISGASAQPGGYTPLGESAAQAARGAPLRRIHGDYRPLRAAAGQRPAGAIPAAPAQSAQAPVPVATSWVPAIGPTFDPQAVAADPATGRVYAVGSATNASGSRAAVLDPATQKWSALPSMPSGRMDALAAVVGGKLYVTGGDNPQQVVYNPSTNQWSDTASPPVSYGDGTAIAVVGSDMYLVGGCGTGVCGETTVQVYHSASDTWTTAAPYPVPVSYAACGGIAGKVYCAGGYSDSFGSATASYVYDPASNSWSPIPALPTDLYGSAYAVANGQLLLSGGVTSDGTELTNQGFAFDPADDAWLALPNALYADLGTETSACGLYVFSSVFAEEFAEQLPGYGDCGGDPWLSASPSSTTIAPGQSATVNVTLNAANPSITQPGTYTATLELANNTPYGTQAIPVTLNVTPPSSWGQLNGTVDAKVCGGTTSPLVGATVQVSSANGTWELTADTTGSYGLWLDADSDPLTLIVSAPGYQSQAAKVTVTAGATTTRNFTLTPTESCS
jgi:hypothetical protein